MRPLAAACAVSAAAALAGASAPERPPGEVPSVFFIAKSENKNQVHFAVAVDERCAPRGDEPVLARWWMLESGPGVIEPLGYWEQSAYGIASQRVLSRSATSGTIALSLKALASRELVVATSARADGSCTASATVRIAGDTSQLESVFVQLGFLHVAWIRLSGRTSKGEQVSEQFSP